MSKKSRINTAVRQFFVDFAADKEHWRYLKSQERFDRKISKNASLYISTGYYSRVNSVALQHFIGIKHKIVREVHKIPELGLTESGDYALAHTMQFTLREEMGNSSTYVYDNSIKFIDEKDEWFPGAATWGPGCIHFHEFPDRFARIFALCEREIDRLFDISSEEALIRSALAHPIGFFYPNSILILHLCMGNPSYFDEMIEYSKTSYEENLKLPHQTYGFDMQRAERIMEAYRAGGFPRFDFA